MSDATGKPLPHTRKISRLPPLPDKVDPIIEQRFKEQRERGAEPLNLHLVQGHAPILSKARGALAWALRNDTSLPRAIVELAILRTAHIVECDYELDHHVPLARMAGVSDAKIEGTRDWQRHAGLYDANEQALLRFIDRLCDKGRVDEATYAELARHFTPRQIVEISTLSSNYYANGLFVKALGIEIDAPQVKAATGKL